MITPFASGMLQLRKSPPEAPPSRALGPANVLGAKHGDLARWGGRTWRLLFERGPQIEVRVEALLSITIRTIQ